MPTQNTGAAPLQTGKGRAVRIPLTYYKSLNGLEKGKLVLTFLAVLVTLGWLAWGAFAQPDGGSSRYSRGPVASAHAKWDTDCQACHVSFSPISGQNLFLSHPTPADKKCQDCHTSLDKKQHPLATADHYQGRVPASNTIASCGGCHPDHGGKDSSLIRRGDSDCTSCHKDLKNHFKSGVPIAFANEVVSFAKHPEFGAYLKKTKLEDPGKLKFNHKLHLIPGQTPSTDSLGGNTLGKFKGTSAYDQFKNAPSQLDKNDTALVTLDCASCHVPQAFPKDSPAAKKDGWYIQSIQYDVHCKACHPLTFDALVKGPKGTFPHGRQLAQVDSWLQAVYEDKDYLPSPLPPIVRPLPGKRPASPDRATKSPKELIKDAARYLTESKAGCFECHSTDVYAGKKEIVPVNVPDVWFKHAKFSHKAHVDVAKCIDCHGGAPTSTESADVLIPPLKKCQECHSASPAAGMKAGRYDCTECHNFHQRDPARSGDSAHRRDPLLDFEWQLTRQGKTGK